MAYPMCGIVCGFALYVEEAFPTGVQTIMHLLHVDRRFHRRTPEAYDVSGFPHVLRGIANNQATNIRHFALTYPNYVFESIFQAGGF